MTEPDTTSDHPSRAARAARAQRDAARRERTREWAVVGGVVALVAAVILAFALWPDGDAADDADGPAVAVTPQGAPEGDLVGEVTEDHGFAFGDPDAPHRVVVYEDFLCPFCGQLETTVDDDLTALVDSGEVVVEYRVLDLLSRAGDYSLRSANAMAVVMQEAGPRAAKTFHDLLYANQPSESAGSFPTDDWLVDQAVVAGADEDAVRPGIEDLVFADWVAEATEAATDDGVQGTPTVLVDGEPVGGRTIADISAAILAAVS